MIATTETVRAMSAAEASDCVRKIHQGLKTCREQVYQLYIRQGWKALGYSSMSDCMDKEFEKTRRYMAMELAAAKVEVNLGTLVPKIGTIPERQLRPIAHLSPSLQMKIAGEVYQPPFNPDHVGGRPKVTAAVVQKAVDACPEAQAELQQHAERRTCKDVVESHKANRVLHNEEVRQRRIDRGLRWLDKARDCFDGQDMDPVVKKIGEAVALAKARGGAERN